MTRSKPPKDPNLNARGTPKKQTNPKSLANLRPFKKGDPRINRTGLQRKSVNSMKEMRALAQEIGNEPLNKAGKTQVEDLLRKMAKSRNPRDRELFLQYMVGKPDADKNQGGGKGGLTWAAIIMGAKKAIGSGEVEEAILVGGEELSLPENEPEETENAKP